MPESPLSPQAVIEEAITILRQRLIHFPLDSLDHYKYRQLWEALNKVHTSLSELSASRHQEFALRIMLAEKLSPLVDRSDTNGNLFHLLILSRHLAQDIPKNLLSIEGMKDLAYDAERLRHGLTHAIQKLEALTLKLDT